ncbi:type VII secretion protein EccE [Streptomyces sp. NBC_00237]|uniref:type VII secretion protein EccE n=1 Tax=Streptomyces sp. NBC_00237 TaxID=2975687 RepID=UPI00225B9E06|nr:type VII secretion protein EccE [Streptomyces sp. NBC_00237]MCX5203834.1 type VII secretion protein EccE [Streptomyces sp. NBC_00237]
MALCEGALAVAAAGVTGGSAWLGPGVAAGAAGVALVVLRRRGRSAVGWLGVAARFRARGRVREAGADSACGVPGLRSYAYERRGGAGGRGGVGMVGDGTFLTALVRVEASGTGLRPAGGAVELPLGMLAEALEVDDVVLASVQVVQQVRGVPAVGGAPAARATWVALRLEPGLCPEAVAARGGGLGGAQRCLVRAADHVASRLKGAGGLRAVVLDREGVDAAVDAAAGGRAGGTGAGAGDTGAGDSTGESVRMWRDGTGLAHTTYAVGGDLRDAVASVAALPGGSGLTATVSLVFRHRLARGSAGAAGHLRVSAAGEVELIAAQRELGRLSRAARLDLVRMDREQVPGLFATLPLGGAR